MDLGIRGRTAIVCGSSRGLGRACAEALAAEGVDIILNGIDQDRLRATADELSQRYQGRVKSVAADITTDEGQRSLLGTCPDPDILVNNNAGPSPGAFLSFDQTAWEKATAANMIAPIMLTRAVLPMMKERHFGRVINITSAMVTTPRPHMALSAGPRAGLTAVMKAISLEVARHNVTI
ncbi:MAG TPA: SDR family NAD(P)-dependent oxidoreductase, partial [Terrimicrobiaceae bacterium]|nr:SDR family NAD(P)-dependent oxidoreductase [Terrimicrobiaceae bacterium]